MAADSVAIAFRNVDKTYDRGRTFAVRAVSLEIAAGEFLAVVGTSGSGKTTLLKTINRLVDPSAGAIEVLGQDIQTLDPFQLRRRIGYVFQGIGLFPHLTVAENIAVTPRLVGWQKNDIDTRIDELLDLVQLPRDARGRMPSTLSGGQRQRVGVARALAARPNIVLMDEPFGALDPITRDSLAREYRAVHRSLALTTVMITHDMLEAVLLADRIAVMRAGEIVEVGTPHDLLNDPKNEYVRELIDVPRRQASEVEQLAGTLR
ncbi:MAG TPA: ATP-binding cassette domain-containing protein [Lacipirellulaceae bacterium]|jgi:osmoprotectant transport system ATP-binding protein|nr:ATP-binding cassette domain-containing protein [Lacipirellulaceae bacterium]